MNYKKLYVKIYDFFIDLKAFNIECIIETTLSMGGNYMQLIYKGQYKDESQLPLGTLPENAVPFKEPKDLSQTNLYACIVIIPVLIIVGLFILISYSSLGSQNLSHFSLGFSSLLGFIMFYIALPIHELLHAICFGKDAEVEFYYSLKDLALFVVSTQPITKRRFIFLSLLPNIVLAWIPFLLWVFIPMNDFVSNFLFVMSLLLIISGVGDYLNAFNAIRQMPKGTMQQLSGFHSFWYYL